MGVIFPACTTLYCGSKRPRCTTQSEGAQLQDIKALPSSPTLTAPPLAPVTPLFNRRCRIHDFLDRFGLVNTRTGGRRPPSYPVPPPAVHLWTPSAFSSKAGWGRGAGPETAVLLQNERVRRGDGVLEGADEREWDRLELMRLMEAAVANPDRWDVVAHQVTQEETGRKRVTWVGSPWMMIGR